MRVSSQGRRPVAAASTLMLPVLGRGEMLAEKRAAPSAVDQRSQNLRVVVEFGFRLASLDELNVDHAIQPFALRATGAEAHPVQFAVAV
jgi:hypothetical protein